MTQNEALVLAQRCAFSHCGIFPADQLNYLESVREMCEVNRCRKYNKSWTCPPACGTLEEMRRKASAYSWGVLLQTTALMEDPLDGEAIERGQLKQTENFYKYCDALHARKIEHLPMSSGGCGRCETCTYPDAPCRFPDRMIPSMEAFGLMVNDVCQLAQIPYYYGRNTITFSGCVLFK